MYVNFNYKEISYKSMGEKKKHNPFWCDLVWIVVYIKPFEKSFSKHTDTFIRLTGLYFTLVRIIVRSITFTQQKNNKHVVVDLV